MADFVHVYPRYVVVDIYKPLFTHDGKDTIQIWDKYVIQALLSLKTLVVRTPNGEAQFSPKAVKKYGEKVKKVFKQPDNPMKMFKLEIPHSQISDNDRWQWS